jgi:hypothetical protein
MADPSMDLHVHLVSPLVHYFPLYLALEDQRKGKQLSSVTYWPEETDADAVHACAVQHAADAGQKSNLILNVVLTSPDVVKSYNDGKTRAGAPACQMSTVYPLITRAPIWCFIFHPVGSQPFSADGDSKKVLPELPIIQQLRKIPWHVYPEGTTTYEFASTKLRIPKDRLSTYFSGTTPVEFGSEFVGLEPVLDNLFKTSCTPRSATLGLITINPWDLPAHRRQQIDKSITIVPITQALFPFTYICVPRDLLDNYQFKKTLNQAVYNHYWGWVAWTNVMKQADLISDMPQSELFSKDAGLQTRIENATNSETGLVDVEALVDGYVSEQKQKMESTHHNTLISDEDLEIGALVSEPRAVATFNVAKRIVDFYVREVKTRAADPDTANKWANHLPNRLYDCLNYLCGHNIYAQDELISMKALGEIDEDQVEAAREVRDAHLRQEVAVGAQRAAEAEARAAMLHRFARVEEDLRLLVAGIEKAHASASRIEARIDTSGALFLRHISDHKIRDIFTDRKRIRPKRGEKWTGFEAVHSVRDMSFSVWQKYQAYLARLTGGDGEPLLSQAPKHTIDDKLSDELKDEASKNVFRLLKTSIYSPHVRGPVRALQFLVCCWAMQQTAGKQVSEKITVIARDESSTLMNGRHPKFKDLVNCKWNQEEDTACASLPEQFYPAELLHEFIRLISTELDPSLKTGVRAKEVMIVDHSAWLELSIVCDGHFAKTEDLVWDLGADFDAPRGLRTALIAMSKCCGAAPSFPKILQSDWENVLNSLEESFVIASVRDGEGSTDRTVFRIRFSKDVTQSTEGAGSDLSLL